MTDNIVAGVYMERNGAMVIRAAKRDKIPWPEIEVLDYEDFHWDPNDPQEAEHYLAEIGALLVESGAALRSVAVASYGPFVSLKRSSPSYGIVHPKISDRPLRGQNWRELFHEGLVKQGAREDLLIRIHTDSNACALGEAVARDLPRDHVLAYLTVTDGVGLGVVTGREIRSSALHPEIGMLHVRYDKDDKLKPPKEANLYAGSLSSMADNRALLERQSAILGGVPTTKQMIRDIRSDRFWEMRAYYLAQACLATTVMLTPHQIVVEADIDAVDMGPDYTAASLTRQKFYRLLEERRHEGAPVFEYDELSSRATFITGSTAIAGFDDVAPFRVTGAIGMCQAAAMAKRKADVSKA